MKTVKPGVLSRTFLILFSFMILSSFENLPGQVPIAVIRFEANGVTEVEASALADRLRNELFGIVFIEVLEREMMNEILAEQAFQQTGCTTDECLVQVGKLIGVRQIVGGTVSKVGSVFSVNARLVDVETGKLLSVSDVDYEGNLEELLKTGMSQVAMELAGISVVEGRELPEPDPGRYYFDKVMDFLSSLSKSWGWLGCLLVLGVIFR